MLDGLNNNVINYFRAVLADITYSARTAISSSLYGVPIATIAFMSIAAGTSLALLVSGPGDISTPTEYTSQSNMMGGTIDEPEEQQNTSPDDEQNTISNSLTGEQLKELEELADEAKKAGRAANRAMRRTARLASKIPQ